MTPHPDPVAAALAIARSAPRSANMANNVTGGLRTPTAGRTDTLAISVPPNAYVIPADIVSAIGQGNTQAGMRVLDHMFGSGAPGAPGTPPSAVSPGSRSVDIAAAGGEYVVPPEVVAAIGHGNLDKGHAVLDALVKKIRAENVQRLSSLPGPKGSR